MKRIDFFLGQGQPLTCHACASRYPGSGAQNLDQPEFILAQAGGGYGVRIIIDRKLCDYSMFALFSTRSLASYLRRQVSRQRRPKPGSAGVYPRAGGYDVREQLLIESYVTIQCSLFFRPAPWRHTCAGRYPASGAAVWIPAGVYPRAGGGGYDVNECFW